MELQIWQLGYSAPIAVICVHMYISFIGVAKHYSQNVGLNTCFVYFLIAFLYFYIFAIHFQCVNLCNVLTSHGEVFLIFQFHQKILWFIFKMASCLESTQYKQCIYLPCKWFQSTMNLYSSILCSITPSRFLTCKELKTSYIKCWK